MEECKEGGREGGRVKCRVKKRHRERTNSQEGLSSCCDTLQKKEGKTFETFHQSQENTPIQWNCKP